MQEAEERYGERVGIDFIVNDVCHYTDELLRGLKDTKEISEKHAVMFFGSMMKVSRILHFIDDNPDVALTHDDIMNDDRLEVAKYVMNSHGKGLFNILEAIDNGTWARETAYVISEMMQSDCPDQQFNAINILDSISLARSAVQAEMSADSLVSAADLISMCPSNFQKLINMQEQ